MTVLPGLVLATENRGQQPDLTGHRVGLFAIAILILNYLLFVEAALCC
jgi:hypothetical protein